MIKIIASLLFVILLTQCSVDTKTGFWEEVNKKKVSNKSKDLNFDYDKSYEQFKENVIQYGKREDFPKLDK